MTILLLQGHLSLILMAALSGMPRCTRSMTGIGLSVQCVLNKINWIDNWFIASAHETMCWCQETYLPPTRLLAFICNTLPWDLFRAWPTDTDEYVPSSLNCITWRWLMIVCLYIGYLHKHKCMHILVEYVEFWMVKATKWKNWPPITLILILTLAALT